MAAMKKNESVYNVKFSRFKIKNIWRNCLVIMGTRYGVFTL